MNHLDVAMEKYNNRVHGTTKMTPFEVLEKVGGNDNPMLSEQIIAIADQLLEYECITINQHQNFVSAL